MQFLSPLQVVWQVAINFWLSYIVGIDAFVPLKHRYSCAMRTPNESCGPTASFQQSP